MAHGIFADPVKIVAQLKPERHEPFNHNLVDGMMVPPFITQQRVDELKMLKLHPNDVFVVTYPKSGSHMSQRFEPLGISALRGGRTLVFHMNS